MIRPWKGIVSAEEEERYRAAGFGRTGGLGKRPALLIIDVQYRTIGTARKPFWDSIEEFKTSCGAAGWDAVRHIAPLMHRFRSLGLPVIYPHVAPKQAFDQKRLAAKVPELMTIPQEAYRFVEQVAPQDGDVLLPKKHRSAFFGTTLASYLIDLDCDGVVVTGCTTSGCVRSSVVDAFSYNFRVTVPEECVYDRSEAAHIVDRPETVNLGDGGFLIENYDVEIKGIELEFAWRPVNGLQIWGNGALNDGKYTGTDSALASLIGNDPPSLPDYEFTVGFDYALDLAGGELKLGSDFNRRDFYYSTPENAPIGAIDPIEILNAYVGYETGPGTWRWPARTCFRKTAGRPASAFRSSIRASSSSRARGWPSCATRSDAPQSGTDRPRAARARPYRTGTRGAAASPRPVSTAGEE